MSIISLEGLVAKLMPVLIPPGLLIREKQFPDTLKVFEEISENPIPPKDHLGRKYLYLTRITGLVWLIWAINFAMFLIIAVSAFAAYAQGIEVEQGVLLGFKVRRLWGILGGLLFFGAIIWYVLIKTALQLQDTCYEVFRRQKTGEDSTFGRSGFPHLDATS
jgi:hypothetical protein